MNLRTFSTLQLALGASVAVESVRLGARDYIFKDQLHRLVPTIIREVQEAEDRLRRDLAEAEVHQSREKLDRLKRFFPATVAERIVSGSQGDPFEWHRKDVTVLFIDLRGFTSFVELSEPEVVVQVLKEYYSGVARAVLNCGGTIGHVAGDGIMAFFNDPMEIPNPQEMAVRAGIQIREELGHLRRKWADMEYSIDFGAGIASGFATVGSIGVEGCWDYSVIGTVTNVAFRLCSAADKGQILIPQRLIQTVSHFAETAPIGTHELKGIHHPLVVFNVIGLKSQPK